jgi:hypothetical protein
VQPTGFMDENVMMTTNAKALFPMGTIVMTKGILNTVSPEDTLTALLRHSQGDWGDLCEQDRETNEEALVEQLRLFSVYDAMDGTRFWIITEHDRSYTTILLPNEY